MRKGDRYRLVNREIKYRSRYDRKEFEAIDKPHLTRFSDHFCIRVSGRI